MMVSQKVVTPVKTGVRSFSNYPKTVDSGFRRNDEISQLLAFCEIIKCMAGHLIGLLFFLTVTATQTFAAECIDY